MKAFRCPSLTLRVSSWLNPSNKLFSLLRFSCDVTPNEPAHENFSTSIARVLLPSAADGVAWREG